MIRVLIKLESLLLSTALARALAFENGIAMVGAMGEGDDLGVAAARLRPHVAVVSQCPPEAYPLQTICASIWERSPQVNVLSVICTASPVAVRPEWTRLAPRVGFVTTADSYDRFVKAIRRLHDGQAVISAEIALSALRANDNPLTERERQVLGMVLTGASTREIADRLYLRLGTVRNYLSSSIGKVGARNRIDACRIARESGWL